MASRLKADVVILNIANGFKGRMAQVMVRQNQKEGIKIDIRIALMGDHGSGKSTLVMIFLFLFIYFFNISNQNFVGRSLDFRSIR